MKPCITMFSYDNLISSQIQNITPIVMPLSMVHYHQILTIFVDVRSFVVRLRGRGGRVTVEGFDVVVCVDEPFNFVS